MELLIRVVDKVQPDPIENPKASKAGDVIVICPDGWPWSVIERTNPEWRIVRCPILQTTAEALLSRNENAGFVRRRDWFVNFQNLAFAGSFTGPRTQEIIEVAVRSVLEAVIEQKP